MSTRPLSIQCVLATAALTIALAAPAAAQVDPGIDSADAARIDSIFSEWDRPGSPGAALGIVRSGRLVFAKGYGMADLEHGVPIGPSTPFHVASESKQFTALMVLVLAERGTLSLDDDVRRWIPEVPDFGPTITIRHLLNHTSGLRDQWQALALAGRYGADAITTGDVLRMVVRQRALNFEPGSMELYCNTGYTLLAEVVARARGTSFRELLRETIFEPLGMRETHVHDDLRELVPRRAESYRTTATGAFERRILNYAAPGATSLWTTVEDMAAWLAELQRPTLASPSTYAPLYARDTLNDGTEVFWGYGMNVGEHRGRIRYGHGGGDAGFRAWSVRFPDDDLGVVVFANLASMNPGPFGDALALAVADLFLPVDGAGPSVPEPDVPGPDLDALVGSYGSPDGRIVNVTNHFGELLVRDLDGKSEARLEPVGPVAFVLDDDPTGRAEFVMEADRASTIEIERDGGVWRGTRVDAVPPGGLGVYAGPYLSRELGTTWTIAASEEGLVARHLMHEDVPLTPVVRDLFEADAWFLREVRFTRDAAGVVDGLLVSAGRIKEVRFERLEDGS